MTTKQAAPATPLPWLLSSGVLVCDQEARVIVNTTPMDVVGVPDAHAFDNAAYIVEACNAYPRLMAEREQLVAALRIALDQIAHLQEISGTDKHGPLDALRDGRALLRQIEGDK